MRYHLIDVRHTLVLWMRQISSIQDWIVEWHCATKFCNTKQTIVCPVGKIYKNWMQKLAVRTTATAIRERNLDIN